MSSRSQAIVAGIVVLLVAMTPTAALLYAISTGAVGTPSAIAFAIAIPAFLIIAAVVAAIARRLDRGLQVAGEHQVSAADAWVPFFLSASVTVVGSFVVPVAILAVMVNSDRSLTANPLFFYTAWSGAFLIVAVVAYGLEWVAERTIQQGRRTAA